jgi:hypothetical protein
MEADAPKVEASEDPEQIARNNAAMKRRLEIAAA